MTTGAVIHYQDEGVFNEETIKHELFHRRQFGFTGDGFVPFYFLEIGLAIPFKGSQDEAYRESTFEAEAYDKEDRHGDVGPDSPQQAFWNIQLFNQNILVTAPGRF